MHVLVRLRGTFSFLHMLTYTTTTHEEKYVGISNNNNYETRICICGIRHMETTRRNVDEQTTVFAKRSSNDAFFDLIWESNCDVLGKCILYYVLLGFGSDSPLGAGTKSTKPTRHILTQGGVDIGLADFVLTNSYNNNVQWAELNQCCICSPHNNKTNIILYRVRQSSLVYF